MRFYKRYWDQIAAGEITAAVRRWDRPRVVAGRHYRAAGTILVVNTVDLVNESEITDDLAQSAGHASASELIADLPDKPWAQIYLVTFHVAPGPDPRAELAATDELSIADLAEIDRRLDRLDRSSTHGPWTHQVLEAIARHPGLRAPDLAAQFGREVVPFKVDVRKLKNLGLTESLRIGYRLSPRGKAYLASQRTEFGENL